MSAAEENAILSGKPMTLGASGHRRGAMTLVLFLLATLIALASGLVGPTSASAKTPGVPQDRIRKNCGSAPRQKFRNTVCPAQQEHQTLIGQMQRQATTKTHITSGSAGGATASSNNIH